MDNKVVAIITARGGSKRIPRKNIKDFCGKPIIAYSIEAALDSGIFQEVMVSTDDEEIAEVSRRYGAKVPFMRSAEASSDYATTADVLTEVLGEYEKRGYTFHKMCSLYPTAPFVTGEKLRMAMKLLESSDMDSVMSVTAFSFPPMRGMYIRDGRLVYCNPEYERVRSQDIETMYHDCGQFNCVKVDVFQRKHTLVMDRTVPFIIPESEVQDIDTIEDWKLAELKYRMLMGENGNGL